MDKDNYIIHGDKLYQIQEGVPGMLTYPQEMAVPKISMLPPIRWQGRGMSLALWRQVLSFFAWGQKEYKSEQQVRLYFNPEEKRKREDAWAVWAPPQEGRKGMTTDEIDDHADWEAQRAQFGDPWEYFGTVHHHCSSSAFQSGTDKDDEDSVNGIHITVGYMDKPVHDLHMRVVFKGQQTTAVPLDWFELPQASLNFINQLTPDLQEKVVKHLMAGAAPEGTTFPDYWKENVLPTVHATTYNQGFQAGDQHRGYGQHYVGGAPYAGGHTSLKKTGGKTTYGYSKKAKDALKKLGEKSSGEATGGASSDVPPVNGSTEKASGASEQQHGSTSDLTGWDPDVDVTLGEYLVVLAVMRAGWTMEGITKAFQHDPRLMDDYPEFAEVMTELVIWPEQWWSTIIQFDTLDDIVLYYESAHLDETVGSGAIVDIASGFTELPEYATDAEIDAAILKEEGAILEQEAAAEEEKARRAALTKQAEDAAERAALKEEAKAV